MFSSTFCDARVCLRCQYRLQKRISRPCPQGVPSGLRSFARNSRHNQQAAQATVDSEEGHEQSLRIRRKIVEGGATKWRHLRLHEDEVPLGVNTLGEPAAIRIVRERPQRFEASRASSPKLEIPLEDLVKSFQEEKESLSREEVHRHIETIRAAFLGKINRVEGPIEKECEEAAHTLQNGFKAEQLVDYIKEVGTFTPSGVDNLDAFLTHKYCRRSRWFAGVSKWPQTAQRRVHPKSGRRISTIFPPPLKDSTKPSRSMTKKQHLARTIIQACWGLRSQEEKMNEGSVAIHIAKDCLELLLMQSETVFDQMQQILSTTIDIDLSLELIRINGRYETCDMVARAIVNEIRQIEETKLRIFPSDLTERERWFFRRNLHNLWYEGGIGEYMAEATNTRISLTGGATDGFFEEVTVLHFGKAKRSVFDVQRYLSQLRKLSAQASFETFPYPAPHYLASSFLPIDVDDNLPFHDRCSKWYRWRNISDPRQRSKEDPAEDGPRFSAPAQNSSQTKAISTSLMSAWRDMENLPDEASFRSHWKPQPETAVIATLGMLCHALTDTPNLQTMLSWDRQTKENTTKDEALEQLTKERRTLHTVIPGILSTIEKVVSSPWTIKHCIKILLLPSKVHSAKEQCYAPSLELEIRLDDDAKTIGLSRARMIHDERVTDLLLPKQGADVRFLAQSWFEADSGNVDPSILTFLSNSNLEIGEKRLDTPPLLSLIVPSTICRPTKPTIPNKRRSKKPKIRKSDSSDFEGLEDPKSGQCVTVEYTMSSINVCSQLSTLYEGFELSVSTVEAGKMGGRREEIRIEAPGIANEEILALSSVAPKKRQYPLAHQQFLGLFAAVKELVARIPW